MTGGPIAKGSSKPDQVTEAMWRTARPLLLAPTSKADNSCAAEAPSTAGWADSQIQVQQQSEGLCSDESASWLRAWSEWTISGSTLAP